jgi:hypothetical protein
MLSPWKKPRGARSRSWHPSEGGRPGHDSLPGCDRLLSPAERDDGTVDCDDHTVTCLDEAIATASTYLTENWIATTVLINPLLEVWEAANAVHPAVARPVEEFLTVLIHRTTVTPAEVNAMVDEVRVLALQASVLAGGTKVS